MDPANRDLLRAAGQLAVIMAMALASTGKVTMARRWWRTARRQADQSGDLDTQLWARDWETVNGTYERRPLPQILALADESVTLADGRARRGTAGVLAGRAQALAVAGRAKAATAALQTLSDVTGRLPASVIADADSMFGWPEVRLRYVESYVHTHIGQPVQAMAAQDLALQLYPPELARERAQLLMHRASCLIQSGHVADGLRYAADVLDDLPVDQHNAMLYEVGRQVVATLPNSERHRVAAEDLRDRLVALPAR